MKYRLFFYQFIFLFIMYGCTNHKQEGSITVLKHQTIDFVEDFIGYGGFLSFYQGSIIGIEMSPSLQPFFYIKPNESPQALFRFGNKGQGPDDFLMPSSIQYIDNKVIGVFDLMSKTYCEFSIPNEPDELKIEKKTKIQIRSSNVIKTAFNQYIGLSMEEKMFLLADSTGMPINTFFEYPYKDNDERQFVSRSHAYQGMIATNLSKDKFVYSSYQGDIIHFYKIGNNNITPIAKIESEYPLYSKRNDNYDGVMFDAKTKIGYIATYATDKFVYAIYSGTKINEIKNVNFEGKILHIFDWNGVLVKEYALDIPCSYLCISDDESKIWAVASNPEITLVFFDLENNQDDKKQAQKTLDLNKNQWIDGSQSTNDESIIYHFEYSIDGVVQDEKTQKEIESIIQSQVMKGEKINLGDNVESKLDTLSENTRVIRFNKKSTNAADK